jgi:hypothetical protein
MLFKQLLFENAPEIAPFSMSASLKSEPTRKNMPTLRTSSPAGTNLFWP